MEIVVATGNKHKLDEIIPLIPSSIKLLTLKDINFNDDIPENEPTLEGNALAKARFIFQLTGKNCLADDTGLEVEALNGEPGVFSARYAGEEKNSEKNMEKLLAALSKKNNRKARFKTVMALIINQKEYLFEGIVNGEILLEKRGEKGFGYDPIFQAEGFDKSFAEMSLDDKNKISHRALATQKVADFLKIF